jgi:hypothetical protein
MKKKMIILSISLVILSCAVWIVVKTNQHKTIYITKQLTVKSSTNKAYDMVKHLSNFPKWSPFLVEDPTQKYEVKGKDGHIGSQYHWEGNGGKDVGYQELVELTENKHIGMQCSIQKPFTSSPVFDYTFYPVKDGVRIQQDFRLKSSFGNAFFLWMFGVKKKMSETNQLGLDLLKKTLET